MPVLDAKALADDSEGLAFLRDVLRSGAGGASKATRHQSFAVRKVRRKAAAEVHPR